MMVYYSILLAFIFALGQVRARKILIIGATGRVGRTVVSKLMLNGNSQVRCLVRNYEKASSIRELAGSELLVGSTNDLNSLVTACDGCHVVVDVHGMSPPRFSKIDDIFHFPGSDLNHPYNVNYLGTKRLLSAMKTKNVKKLVRITGSLIGKSPFLLPVILFNILLSMSPKWHERSELAIRDSEIDYTVIRPTEIIAEPPASTIGRSLVLLQGDSRERAPLPGKIAISDVADICVAAATNDETLCRRSVVVSSMAKVNGENVWADLIPKVILNLKILKDAPNLYYLFYIL